MPVNKGIVVIFTSKLKERKSESSGHVLLHLLTRRAIDSFMYKIRSAKLLSMLKVVPVFSLL